MGNVLRSAKDLVADGVRKLLPLSVWQRLYPKDVVGLAYHIVSDQEVPHLTFYPFKTAAQFEADVACAVERYGVLRYDELVSLRLGSGQVPPNRCVFTFDDGLVECFDIVRPILSRHRVDGIFFAIGSLIGNPRVFFEAKISLCVRAIDRLSEEQARGLAEGAGLRPGQAAEDAAVGTARTRLGLQTIRPRSAYHELLFLELLQCEVDDVDRIDRWSEQLGIDPEAYVRQHPPYATAEQLRQMAAEGFTIGGHTVTHRKLQRLDFDEAAREIVESCDMVRQITGQRQVPFAFPYSGATVDRQRLADLRARHPFLGLFFDMGGLRPDAPFVVNRVWTDLPHGCRGNSSNLPELLLEAWRSPLARC